MNIWLSLVWLIAVFLLMAVVRRWIEAHVQGLAYLITGHPTVAIWVFFLVFLPGILVHELSHWLAAKVLGVHTGRIVIWPQAKRNNTVWLGTIQVGRADPLRSSLIGLAPLLTGSLLVVLIGAHLRLDSLADILTTAQWETGWAALSQSIGLPDFWLWIYLIFAIANRMLPSPADREAWKPMALFLACLTAIAVAAGWTPRLGSDAQGVIQNILGFLLYAFTLTVAIDLIMALVITILEAFVGLIRRQRVSY